MKNLKDYQMRVVDELEEINKRTHKLFEFILVDSKTANLQEEELHLLNKQLGIMEQYVLVLTERIEYFVRTSPERDS